MAAEDLGRESRSRGGEISKIKALRYTFEETLASQANGADSDSDDDLFEDKDSKPKVEPQRFLGYQDETYQATGTDSTKSTANYAIMIYDVSHCYQSILAIGEAQHVQDSPC